MNSFDSWWEIHHHSLPVHDPYELAKAVLERGRTRPTQPLAEGHTPELLPCPFCGETSNLELANTHTASFWVECLTCRAKADGEYFPGPHRKTRFVYSSTPRDRYEASYDQLHPEYQQSANSAIAAWNRRTLSPAPIEGRRTWVTCPICGESDMQRNEEPDYEGRGYIHCVNLNCRSNGGTNDNLEERYRLQKLSDEQLFAKTLAETVRAAEELEAQLRAELEVYKSVLVGLEFEEIDRLAAETPETGEKIGRAMSGVTRNLLKVSDILKKERDALRAELATLRANPAQWIAVTPETMPLEGTRIIMLYPDGDISGGVFEGQTVRESGFYTTWEIDGDGYVVPGWWMEHCLPAPPSPSAQGEEVFRWRNISNALPVDGEFIVGRNNLGATWDEKFDLTEPLGQMVQWRPMTELEKARFKAETGFSAQGTAGEPVRGVKDSLTVENAQGEQIGGAE